MFNECYNSTYARYWQDRNKSNEILNKPSALSNREYEEVKRHPEIGYQILKSADVYTEIGRVCFISS